MNSLIMQFLHLLLPLVLICLVDSGWVGRTDTQAQNGKLSDEGKEQLQQTWGFDPETRKNRLAELSKKTGPTLTEEQKKKFDELAAKMTELKPENQEKTPDDQFEANMKEGMTDYLFEGDIQLSEDQLQKIERSAEGGRNKRQASANHARWTNNTVYYFFDKSINQAQKNAVAESIDFLTRRTCLKFVLNAAAKNRIRFFTGKGCWSGIGMAGGQQDLSLGGGCENVGTVIHEMMHALGIWHMQHRYDRDNYVLIDTSPVAEDEKHNFNKLQPEATVDSTPYEYGSVMHYSATTFSTNGKPVMVPLDSRYSVTIGSKIVSFYDLKMINDHYECPAAPLNCQNGGFPNPSIPGRCICPAGYGHILCDVRPFACGEELNATANWQTTQLTAGTPNDASTVLAFRYCYHWITAPKGKKVQVKLTAMEKSTCHNGCGFNGIEPKVLPNPEVTNPRYCCPAQLKGEVLTSELNPMPVIAYNRNHYTKFTFQYRFVDTPPTVTTTPKPTVAPKPNLECVDTQADCAQRKLQGFCQATTMPLNFVNMACAVTCGLCETKVFPCYDRLKDECAAFDCNGASPMMAEFNCAKTCGFCGANFPKLVVTPQTTTIKTTTQGIPEVTVKPTTVAPVPEQPVKATTVASRDCHDTQTDCAVRKAQGFCEMKQQPFNIVKMACAATCGICGIPPSPCYDMNKEQCNNYDCNGEDPMFAEFYCAKTCGFCGIPAPVTPPTTPAAPLAKRDCHDTQPDCATRKANGICEMKQQPFNIVKMACAESCNLCGKSPSPCNDMLKDQCATYDCSKEDPMIAEFYCSKTCGFCEKPN